jgi:hypothetical protein
MASRFQLPLSHTLRRVELHESSTPPVFRANGGPALAQSPACLQVAGNGMFELSKMVLGPEGSSVTLQVASARGAGRAPTSVKLMRTRRLVRAPLKERQLNAGGAPSFV